MKPCFVSAQDGDIIIPARGTGGKHPAVLGIGAGCQGLPQKKTKQSPRVNTPWEKGKRAEGKVGESRGWECDAPVPLCRREQGAQRGGMEQGWVWNALFWESQPRPGGLGVGLAQGLSPPWPQPFCSQLRAEAKVENGLDFSNFPSKTDGMRHGNLWRCVSHLCEGQKWPLNN